MEQTSNPTHQVDYSGPSARADPIPGCLPRPPQLDVCQSVPPLPSQQYMLTRSTDHYLPPPIDSHPTSVPRPLARWAQCREKSTHQVSRVQGAFPALQLILTGLSGWSPSIYAHASVPGGTVNARTALPIPSFCLHLTIIAADCLRSAQCRRGVLGRAGQSLVSRSTRFHVVCRGDFQRESVLFIGRRTLQFSNHYTAVDTPAKAA
jgi:hypothetical protein